MAETTGVAQLSGAEIIEAVLDRLRTKMQNDCYLNATSAYDWFSAKIVVELAMHDTGTKVLADYVVETSQGPYPPAEEMESGDVILEIAQAAPNVVRVETGQPVPTRTRDAKGREVIQGVRYARKDAKKAAK